MKYHTIKKGNSLCESVTNIMFDDKADVAVVGLGTAGSVSAVTAAENGLDVIGIEQNSGMGGLSSYGCVGDYYYGSKGGKFEEINREVIKLQKSIFAPGEAENEDDDYRCFNGIAKSVALEKAAVASGCRLFFETTVTGVYTENGRIIGISCLREGKEFNICAKMFIDSTGGALLCRFAGLKTRSGRDSDGRQMRFSETIVTAEDGLVRGRWTMNGNRENKTAMELSQIILEGLSLSPCLMDKYSTKKRTVFNGTVLGMRESARIVPHYELKFSDVLSGRQSSKPLFYAFSPVDNVNRDVSFDSEVQQLWRLVLNLNEVGLSIGVPLETLIPKDIDGVIVAGKGIGVDCDLASCIRMKKDMEKCGEAAAAAAFLCVKQNKLPEELEYEDIAKLLRKSGCLDEKNNIGFGKIRGGMEREKLQAVKEENLAEVLMTDFYGLGILYILKNRNKDIIKKVNHWLDGENDILRERAAFAGGVLSLDKALPVLLELSNAEPEILPWQPAYKSKVACAVFLLRFYRCKKAYDTLCQTKEKYAFATAYTEDKATPETEMAYLLKTLAERGIEKFKKDSRGEMDLF